MQTNSTFTKHDNGKPGMSFLPWDALEEIAKVMDFGAKKYGRDNWKKVKPDEMYRYKDAMCRHMSAYLKGETHDPESGLTHLAHMGCNVVFLMYLEGNSEAHKFMEALEEMKVVPYMYGDFNNGN